MSSIKMNTANGSVTLIGEDGSGNIDITVPRTGFGKVLQVSFKDYNTNGTFISTASTSFFNSGINITITPKSLTSRLYIEAHGNINVNNTNGILLYIDRDGVNLHSSYQYSAGSFVYVSGSNIDDYREWNVNANVISGSLNPTTFTVYLRAWTTNSMRIGAHAGKLDIKVIEVEQD